MAESTGLQGLFYGFDRINAVAAGLENRLEVAATDYATDLGTKDGLEAVQRLPDGSLAPLDLTPGLTSSQRAYNQAARNTYIARTQLDAEAMATQLMQKYPLDPDSFRSAWEGYMSGTLKSEQNSRVGPALTLDLIKLGNRAYAGLSSAKLEYDRADQKATLIERGTQVKMQASSYAARTGSTNSDEIKDAQKEFDAITATLLRDRQITHGEAEKMRRTWAVDITMDAFKKQVYDAFERGKTPLGPGSLVDAQRVARELSMKAAEELMVQPDEAFRILMGGAQASQQIKAAIIGEKREQMQIENESYARQQRAYHIASERALGTMLLERSNGTSRPLFPGSSGDDVVEGGEGRKSTVFTSQAEMIQKLGPSGAAQLIARDQAWRKEQERDANTARNQARTELAQSFSVAQPVTTIGEDRQQRFGLLLPDGKVITGQADIDKITDDDFLRFKLAGMFNASLSQEIKQRATADDTTFTQQIASGTAAIDAIATKILSNGAQQADMVRLRDALRLQFNDPGLSPERQVQVGKMMNEAEKRVAEVDRAFAERREVVRKMEAAGPGGVSLDEKQRRILVEMRPEIDISKPSEDMKAARQTVANYADVLRRTGMQVDSGTAMWLTAVLQHGNISGGQSEVDLRKAFTFLDQIETMPDFQKTAFRAEMEKVIPGWSEVSTIARRAMQHHNASGTEVRDGDNRFIRYGVSYQQAFSDMWKGYQQAKTDGQAQTGYTAPEAVNYLRTNVRDVVPQIVRNMGWIDWGAWQVNTSSMEIPQQMAERFADLVRQESLLGSGQFGRGQAELAAVARLKADGWYPTTMETPPKELSGGPRVQWKQRPLEWQLEKEGFEFGKEAMQISAAAAIAEHRGQKFDDVWKQMQDGRVTFVREPNSTRANIVLSVEDLRVGNAMPMRVVRPDFVRGRDGKPLSIDIGSSDFRQFHMDLTRDVFQRTRDFDVEVKIPKLEIDNLPVGQKLIENKGGTMVPIPLGSLIRDRVATPGSGTAARRSLERLIGINEEQRAP